MRTQELLEDQHIHKHLHIIEYKVVNYKFICFWIMCPMNIMKLCMNQHLWKQSLC